MKSAGLSLMIHPVGLPGVVTCGISLQAKHEDGRGFMSPAHVLDLALLEGQDVDLSGHMSPDIIFICLYCFCNSTSKQNISPEFKHSRHNFILLVLLPTSK